MVTYRDAQLTDIPQMQRVRHAVKENILSDPGLITDADYVHYLSQHGKGFVALDDNLLVAFAIAGLTEHLIWALFVQPEFEGKGIGKTLHDQMMNWYFSKTSTTVWLSTSANTRAASFYTKAGWKETGLYGKGEIKFEMTAVDWMRNHF